MTPSSPPSTSRTETNFNSLSSGMKTAIGLGLGIGGMLVLLGLLLFWLRRRRRENRNSFATNEVINYNIPPVDYYNIPPVAQGLPFSPSDRVRSHSSLVTVFSAPAHSPHGTPSFSPSTVPYSIPIINEDSPSRAQSPPPGYKDGFSAITQTAPLQPLRKSDIFTTSSPSSTADSEKVGGSSSTAY